MRSALPILVAVAACGGKAVIDPVGADGTSSGGGASTPTGATSTTSNGSGAGGSVPPLTTICPGGEQPSCQTELEAVTLASDWGPSAELVAADGRYLVGFDPTANAPAFLLEVTISGPDVTSVEPVVPSPAPLAPVDVIDGRDGPEVLGCDGPTCLLTRYTDDLVEIVPAPTGARGLVALGSSRCVYGQGVRCSDDGATWTTVFEGGTWLDGASADGKAWFVGEGGSVGRWDGTSWFDPGLPDGPSLRAVATSGDEAVAAGDQGAVVIVNDGGARASCVAGDDWVGVARRFGEPSRDDFSLLSATDWWVKDSSSNQWCRFGVMTPSPLALDHDTCGSSTRWRLLFADRYFASQDCEP